MIKPASAAKGNGRRSPLELRLAAGGLTARLTTHSQAQAKRAEQFKPGTQLRVRLRSVDARRGRVDVELL